MFITSVTMKSVSPKEKALSVSELSKAWSPCKACTICTVTVVISSRKLKLIFGRKLAAITTIIVSPKARESPSKQAAMMPGIASGKITAKTTSFFVIPRAYAAFMRFSLTASMQSCESDATMGTIIMPIIKPAPKALS